MTARRRRTTLRNPLPIPTGQEIKAYRRARGHTIKMGGALVGTSMRAWHRYECGDTEIALSAWEVHRIRCGMTPTPTGETLLQRVTRRISEPVGLGLC